MGVHFTTGYETQAIDSKKSVHFSNADDTIPHTTSIHVLNTISHISDQLDTKLQLLSIYKSELGEHPFPRSLDTVRALALVRGAQMGAQAAEAFQILRHFE